MALPQQRDYLRNRWQEWEEFYNRISERLAGIRPRVAARTLCGLVAVLGGLLAAGLVWPLFYLSSRGGGSRDWALGLFIVLAGAFLLFLLNEVRRLQRSLDLERQWS